MTETIDVLDKIADFYSFESPNSKTSKQIIIPVAIAGGAVIAVAISITAVLLIKKRR